MVAAKSIFEVIAIVGCSTVATIVVEVAIKGLQVLLSFVRVPQLGCSLHLSYAFA